MRLNLYIVIPLALPRGTFRGYCHKIVPTKTILDVACPVTFAQWVASSSWRISQVFLHLRFWQNPVVLYSTFLHLKYFHRIGLIHYLQGPRTARTALIVSIWQCCHEVKVIAQLRVRACFLEAILCRHCKFVRSLLTYSIRYVVGDIIIIVHAVSSLIQ